MNETLNLNRRATEILNKCIGFNPNTIESEQSLNLWEKETKNVSGEPVIVFLSPFDMGSQAMDYLGQVDKDIFVFPRKVFKDGASVPRLSGNLLSNKERVVLYSDNDLEAKVDLEPVDIGEEISGRGVIIIASMDNADAVNDVTAAARWMRANFEVPEVMLMATRLPGLRQDGIFLNGDDIVQEPSLAFEVIEGLANKRMFNGDRLINRMLALEVHSKLTLQYAYGLNFPMLAVTGYGWVANQTGVVRPYNLSLKDMDPKKVRVVAPDKNRHTTASKLAELLGMGIISFKKGRDRDTGLLKLLNGPEALQQLQGVEELIVFDDEFQTGSTMKMILDSLPDGIKVTIIAMHANFTKEARVNLDHPAVKRVVTTDAMIPGEIIRRFDKTEDKNLMILQLGDSLVNLTRFLWDGDLKNELPDGWLLDPWYV